MKKFTLFIIISILLMGMASFAAAETIPSGIPLSELEQFIDEFVADHIGVKTAGASIAIVKDGQFIFNKAYGYAIQDEILTSIDDVFEWGSATKLLLWTSVMQLAEQGKLDLNNDIREYLPVKFLKKLKYDTPITMYNLMHHNAGWEDRMVDLFYSKPKTVPDLEGALLSWEPKQVFKPGSIVAYSNFGTGIAGLIIERITGIPFYQYVQENIFEPLGMKDTAIHPIQEDNPSVAERREQIKGHVPGNEKPIAANGDRIYIGLYPAGSVIGTTQDAIKFLSALMPGSETSVLFNENKTLNEMLSVSLLYREGFPRFSHGFMEHYCAVRALGHGGNTVAFSSLFTIAPDERFGVVIMTNQAGESAICSGLTRALFGEFTAPEYIEEFPDVSDFTGTYTIARKPTSGFTNLISSLQFFPVKAIDENTLDVGGAKFVQISPYMFKNTGGLEFLDIIDYIFVETENGSVKRFSVSYFDLVPISVGKMIINIGSAILFILCILYTFAAVIISIIGAIRNKKKSIPSNLMKKLNIILYVSMAAIILNNIILAVRALSFSIYSSLLVHFTFNILFVIFVPVCVSLMWINRKKEPAKASKVFNMFTMISAVIFIVFLIGWEFWR